MRFSLFLLSAVAFAAPSLHRIEEIWKSDPAAARAVWGISVLDAETGKPLLEYNANRYFVPASNTKLMTSALALIRLGPDFRFTTRVVAQQPIGAGGVLRSDLRLLGEGDPNLSGRVIPYQKNSPPGDPLLAIEELAEQLVRKGLKVVQGDIVGDDGAYIWEPYPSGWAQDDTVSSDGAPVSALAVNDNEVMVTIRPAAWPGELASLALRPTLDYFVWDNRVTTARPGEDSKVEADRDPGSNLVHLWGAIAAQGPPVSIHLSVDDPALFAATALRDALERRGVRVAGTVAARHRYPDRVTDLNHGRQRQRVTAPPVELATRRSAPLAESLRVLDKVSQNLHAEMMLRAVGRARRGIGSRQAGLEELKSFLAEAGIKTDGVSLRDGSGLSRLNLVTPEAMAQLLVYMSQSPQAEIWRGLLPVGGVDGTLDRRFEGLPEAERVQAKTGSLTHVSALSGYVETRAGRLLAFSILVNNYVAKDAEIRHLIDRISLTLVE